MKDVPDKHTTGVALEPAFKQPDQFNPLLLSGLQTSIIFVQLFSSGRRVLLSRWWCWWWWWSSPWHLQSAPSASTSTPDMPRWDEVLRNLRLFIKKDVVNEHFYTKNTLIWGHIDKDAALQIAVHCCSLLPIVAHCCTLLPVVAHCCPCLPIVAYRCPLLPHCCPLLPIVAHCFPLLSIVAPLLPMVTHCCPL